MLLSPIAASQWMLFVPVLTLIALGMMLSALELYRYWSD